MIQNVFFICQSNTHFDSFGDINDEEMMKKAVQYFQASCGIVKCSHFPRFTGLRPECLAHNRGGDEDDGDGHCGGDGDDGGGEVLYMCVWYKVHR